MQEKKKLVITGSHVLFFGGLFGTLFILVAMGIHWFRDGTPFFGITPVTGNTVFDTLFTLAWPLFMFLWGLSALRKRKEASDKSGGS